MRDANGFIIGTLFGFVVAATAGIGYFIGRQNTANEVSQSCNYYRDVILNGVIYGCAPKVPLDPEMMMIHPNPPVPSWAKKR